MKIKNILFIIPNSSWFGKRYWQSSPYTIGLLTAVLSEKGYHVDLIDANLLNLNEKEVENAVENASPTVVAISAMTVEYRKCVHKTFEIVKNLNNNIITVIGGVYPTLSPEIVTKDKNIDFCLIGEGEIRFPQLLSTIELGGSFNQIDGLIYYDRTSDRFIETEYNVAKNRIKNLDELPFPDYSLFDMKKYINYGEKYTQNFQFRRLPVGQTITSRGCPYNCVFCASNNVFGKAVTFRSPENVLQEIDMLVEKFGIKEIIFVDDNFLLKRSRAVKILKGLVERNYDLLWKSNNLAIFHMDRELLELMKKSGCYQITVSIESGHPSTLKRMKKPVDLEQVKKITKIIKELGIELISNYVIGIPGDKFDEIRATFEFAENLDLDYSLFSIATPLPATELYEMCKKQDCIAPDFGFENFDYYGFGRGSITTDEFTPFELQVLRAFEWDRINFKTLEKKIKIAGMLGITIKELEVWRKKTRRNVGVNTDVYDRESQ